MINDDLIDKIEDARERWYAEPEWKCIHLTNENGFWFCELSPGERVDCNPDCSFQNENF